MRACVLALAALALMVLSGCSVSLPSPTPTPAVVALPISPAVSSPAARAVPPTPVSPVRATPSPASPTPTRVLSAPLPTGIPEVLARLTPLTAVTALPVATPAAALPSAPSAGAALAGRIVLQTASGGDIVVVHADGSAQARLAAGLDPAWSPDGRRVAFARWEEPQGIYVMNGDGSALRLVYRINGAKSPTWSPDGARIAFTWRYKLETPQLPPGVPLRFTLPAQDAWRVSIIDLATGDKTDLPLDPDGHAFSPHWGLDGRVVYKGVRGLWVTTEAGPPQRISDDPWHWTPTWSPDGRKIALALRRHDHWDIAVMNSDGSGLAYLTQSPIAMFTTPTDNVAPVWSPDGESIAFLSNREGQWRVYVMNADGSGQRRLLDIAIAYDFAAERVLNWTR